MESNKSIEIRVTSKFEKWLKRIKDSRAKGQILAKLEYLRWSGNLTILKPIRNGLFELRIHEGQGYRVYITIINGQVVVLVGGGTKSTQPNDIKEFLKDIS
jgi:putative addiction module killer protein